MTKQPGEVMGAMSITEIVESMTGQGDSEARYSDLMRRASELDANRQRQIERQKDSIDRLLRSAGQPEQVAEILDQLHADVARAQLKVENVRQLARSLRRAEQGEDTPALKEVWGLIAEKLEQTVGN